MAVKIRNQEPTRTEVEKKISILELFLHLFSTFSKLRFKKWGGFSATPFTELGGRRTRKIEGYYVHAEKGVSIMDFVIIRTE